MRGRGSQFRVRFVVDGDGKIVSTFEAVHAGAEKAKKPVEGLAAELVDLSDRLDKTAAANRQYARDATVLDEALKRGLVTSREHTRLMDKAWQQTPDAEKWARFGDRVGRSMMWAGGAVAAATALVVRNSVVWENQLAQLDAVHASTANAVGMTRDELVGLAEDLARVSTFGRTEIVEAEARLLSYSGIIGTNFPRAMQAVIDQSARLDLSLAQSAETIGRALESPSKAAAALSDQGFGAAFTDEVRGTIDALVEAGREAEAQILILEILEESYAGAAAAARDSFGGSLVALKNRLSDLMTGDDGSLDGATDALNDLIDTLNDPRTEEGFDAFATGAVNLTGALVQMIAKLGEAGLAIQDVFFTDTGGQSEQLLRNRQTDLETQLFGARRQAEASERRRRLFSPSNLFGGGQSAAQAQVEELERELAEVEAELHRRRVRGLVAAGVEEALGPAAPTAGPVDTSDLDLRTKEERDAAKKAADDELRAREQLEQRMQSYLGRLEQANELHGDNTELARANYEIQANGLDELNPALAEAIRREAELRDSQRENAEARTAGERVIASNRTALERLIDTLAQYDALLAANALTAEQHAVAVARAQAGFDASEERIRQQNRTMVEAMLEDWGDLGAGLDYAMVRSIDNVSDRLHEMAMRGEADISQLAETIISEFTRVMINKSVSDLLGAFGEGTENAGGLWGWIGNILSGSRATGGGVRGGGLYEITEHNRPEVLRQGNDTFLIPGRDGVVLPALPMAASGGAAAGSAAVPQIRVEIENRGGQMEVESAAASRQPDGTIVVRMVQQAVKAGFARGDFDDSMRGIGIPVRRGVRNG